MYRPVWQRVKVHSRTVVPTVGWVASRTDSAPVMPVKVLRRAITRCGASASRPVLPCQWVFSNSI